VPECYNTQVSIQVFPRLDQFRQAHCPPPAVSYGSSVVCATILEAPSFQDGQGFVHAWPGPLSAAPVFAFLAQQWYNPVVLPSSSPRVHLAARGRGAAVTEESSRPQQEAKHPEIGPLGGLGIARRFDIIAAPGRRALQGRMGIVRIVLLVLAVVTIAIVVAFIVGMGAWKHQMDKKGQKPPIVRLLEKHRALKLPDKPSIAVLPFTNMSGDIEQDYFSDGMTEDLITDLSQISGLFVISRNSVFTYKGKAVKIEEVAKDLGVRYVLEGSVRRVSDQVRITAQLIDAKTGHHVWAERYDRDMKDIFALQDEVTGKIVEALAVNLVGDEHARLTKKGTDNLGAYDLVLRGSAHLRRHTKENNEFAREVFAQAVQLDPNYTAAYAGLVWTRLMAWMYGWSHDPKLLDEALELGKKAVSLDESSPQGHVILGDVYLWKKRHGEAIAEFEKAVSLNPNDADALSSLGGALVFSGLPEKALGYIEKAIRLNPNYPEYYMFNLGQAFFQLKMYEEAVTALRKSIIQNSNFMPAHYVLAACYGHLGKQELARAKAEDVKRMIPGFSIEGSFEILPLKNEEDFEHFAEGLRKAGLH